MLHGLIDIPTIYYFQEKTSGQEVYLKNSITGSLLLLQMKKKK